MDAPTAATAGRRFPRAAFTIVLVSAALCLAAIFFRVQIQSRYWAQRVIAADDSAERAQYLTLLCNAGDAGRWGTTTLLGSADAVIRQHGVVVLHHVRTPWAESKLTALLADPDAAVAELAALGLALRGDERVVPQLRALYAGDSDAAAASACIALGRMGTPGAIAALTEFAAQPAPVERVAALVDALDDVGTAAAVPGLLRLLDDERVCTAPSRRERRAEELLRGIAIANIAPPDSPPEPRAATIAARAAAALARITGIEPPFSTTLPADAQAAARAVWDAWLAEHADRNPPRDDE